MVNTVKNLLIVLKNSSADVLKAASKKAIRKTTEATCDLIGNKITRTTSQNTSNKSKTIMQTGNADEIPREICILPEEKKDKRLLMSLG